MVATIGKYVFARWHYAFISKHFRTCNCSHFVEPLLGRKNYFILYILSDFVEALQYLVVSNSISVGASGAIFGLWCNWTAFNKCISEGGKRNTNDDWNLCWYKFTLGLTGGIDNAAHIGGLLAVH
jgi:rhomboid protease GluP